MKIQRASVLVFALAVLATSAFVTSCNKDSSPAGASGPVVARVGDREVTLSYFEERLEKMERRFLPDTLDMEGKREFLEFIINKELMALKAEALGYAEDELVKGSLESLEDALITKAATDHVTAGMDSVAEEDIRAFYDSKQTQRLAKHIMVATKPVAEEVHNALINGADFDSLVDVHSIVPRLDGNGQPLEVSQRGMFGWVEFGQATPSVEEAIYGGPMNHPSQPVQTPYGWHVFYPVATRDRKQRPYEEMKELIRQQIAGRRKRAATEAYYDEILEKRGYDLDEDALELVYSKLPEDTGQVPDVNFEVKPVIPFTYEERETTLFELGGKKYTIGDFSDRFDVTNFNQRPKRQNGTLGLRLWIRDEWMKHLKREEAEANGMHELPEVVNELKMRSEETMVSALHANLIQQQLPEPTEDELLAYFNEHEDSYVDHEKRVCNVIFHPRERVVRRAYQAIQEGADFVETAIRYNDSAVDAEDVRTAAFTRNDEKHADIVDVAFGLELNQYSEPFKVSSELNNGWILLQLHQVIPEKPFVYEDVEEFVRRDWQNSWSENRLNELLAEWRRDFDVRIYDDVLARAEVRRDDVVVPSRSAQAAPAESGAGDTP